MNEHIEKKSASAMSREELLLAAEQMRANPPAYFQIEGLHDLDHVTSVSEHWVDYGTKKGIHFFLIKPVIAAPALPFVINIHGGGMVRDHGDRDILFGRRLAFAAGCAVISLDYKLAPQYPYPYAIGEVEELIQYLLKEGKTYGLTQKYILSGQSSGGHLALVGTLRSVQKGFQKPELLMLAYSWLDGNTEPGQKPGKCPESRLEMYRFYSACYLDCVDTSLPEISPALAPAELYSDFPEVFMIEGGQDELREENMRMFRTFCDAAVPASLHYFPDSMHGFMINQMADWEKAQKLLQDKVKEVFA